MNGLRRFGASVLLALLLAVPAGAAGKKRVLGVFLPTTLADGQARFQFGEQLAAALTERLGEPVTVKNFGRYEDFAVAAKGKLDLVVVDAWAAAQLGLKGTPVGAALVDGAAPQPWAIVTRDKATVSALAGKRLAVPRGGKEDALVSHAVFGGDLDAGQHFTLVPVPNVESALRLLEAKGAEAALVPARHAPPQWHVAFRSSPMPGALLVTLGSDAARLTKVVETLPAIAPVEGFRPVAADEVTAFRTLLQKGPPARQPVMVESPLVPADPNAIVNVDALRPVLPDFTAFVEPDPELPDP